MAEGGGSWWGNIVSVAKTKSVEVLEFMKKDIEEFSTVVKNEASSIANQTASAVKETLQLDDEESTANNVKRSVSSFLGSVKEVLSPSPSIEFEEALVIHDGNPVTMTKLQKKIHALISDDATYLVEISDDDASPFDAWLSVASDTLDSVERLTHLLSVNPSLQDKYTVLVPDQVSHTDFWRRYLFRRAVLEDKEAELERKTERGKRQAESFTWETVEDFPGGVDLSEEEQTRILAEYEEEQRRRGGGEASTPTRAPENVEREANICVQEKKDMIIVGNSTTDFSQTSSSSKASTDGDWEKEFDIDETDCDLK